MDVRNYIESGILETYAMGQATSQEQREVQCLSKIYPEIANELAAIEANLENLANAQKKTPPAFLKQNIMAAIANVEQESPLQKVPEEKPQTETATAKTEEPKVVRPRFNLAAVAAVFFAVALAGTLFFFVNDGAQTNQQIEQLAAENAAKEKELKEKNLALEAQKSALAAITDPAVTQVKLAGTEKYPSALAQVYWNSATGDVILNANQLANLPDGKQYQLWVLVDGQPVDMGMVPTENSEDLIKMKNTAGGQHFAITIEKSGGSPTPNLEEMVVFGTIAT